MKSLCLVLGVLIALGACAEQKTAVRERSGAARQTYVDPPPPPAGAPTVLLMDLEGDRAEEGDAYTPYARRGLLSAGRAFVVRKSEITERLAACEDAACHEEVSAALSGARYVVSGSVGRVNETYVVQLKLLEPATSAVLGRVSRHGRGDPEGLLFDAAKELSAAIPVP